MHESWEEVWSTDSQELHRMAVPGGWLYRFVHYGSQSTHSIAFVPQQPQDGDSSPDLPKVEKTPTKTPIL